MTRTYALKRLLEHGGLTYGQINAITGWPRRSVDAAIRRLQEAGLLTQHGRPMRYVYSLTGDLT